MGFVNEVGAIEVLLSTCNGRSFVSEQIESISRQTSNGILLRIRDDGSMDGTFELLEKLALENNWVSLHKGKNIGVFASFLWLLNQVDHSAKFVAFCDQDDIWDPDKISRATHALNVHDNGAPALYCSAVRRISATGEVLTQNGGNMQTPSFLNALVQNIATGCTMVLNRAAVDLLIRRAVQPVQGLLHDRWAYLVISAFGTVIYDPEPSMSYRQHQSNVVGSRTGLRKWGRRVYRFRARGRKTLVLYASELYRVYGPEMPIWSREQCELFVSEGGSDSFLHRLRYVASSGIFRQTRIDDLIMRFLVVLGWR